MDWDLMMQLKRDICLLYHELAEHPGIDGDLAYSSLYPLPYWRYVGLARRDADEAFVADGCLVMILAMAWDLIAGSGSYLEGRLDECRAAVDGLGPCEGDTATLTEAVCLALDTAAEKRPADPRLQELSVWVNRTYVYGYFRDTAARLAEAHS